MFPSTQLTFKYNINSESHEVEEERQVNSIAPTTCLTLQTIVFVDKLPHNIIWCKAYGIPNAQNKTCEMLNGS